METTSSKVWLVSLDNRLGGRSIARKELIQEYTSNDKNVFLPIGMVIEHSGTPHIHEVFDDGFEYAKNLVPRKMYDNVDISKLEGQLLTLIDASFADPEQRKAFKDTVRQLLWQFNAGREREIEEIFKNTK